ncbi:hypothetical protein FJ251_03285 [bacterium]|nr:hypothetical protein [bacterium]
MRRCVLALAALLAAAPLAAQEDSGIGWEEVAVADEPADRAASGSEVLLRSRRLVDSPTAVVLGHGAYRIEGRLMHGGSLAAGTFVGIKDRLEVGVCWGMRGLFGRGEVEFNDRTALSLRLLLAEERALPALLIGFDNQGWGPWDEALERYERKSKGFYFVATRNWYGPLGTDVATSGGFNYSTEDKDESSLDFFAGLEQDYGGNFALILDYAVGLNDRADEEPAARYGRGLGWLDAGLRWNVVGGVQFKFFLRDLLANYRVPYGERAGRPDSVDRQFEISYEGSF